MRSITLKMVLAFLAVSLVSILLIVLFTRWKANEEFKTFLVDQNRPSIVTAFSDYYREHRTWKGVDAAPLFPEDPGRIRIENNSNQMRPFTLVNDVGQVVLPGEGYSIGAHIPASELERGISILVDKKIVGTLLVNRRVYRINPPESMFLERMNSVLFISALIAAIFALLLGILLSRTLTRPIRELTAATRVVSEGNLVHEVPVRSSDELGQLAASFNRMSAELARSLNLRRQMTVDIAHELRTPISLILGHAEAIHDGVLSPSVETLEIIREEAGRLEHLVEDLRLLSRADAGELSLERQMFDPRKLLEDIRAIHTQNAIQKNITIQIEVVSHIPLINVDPQRMMQVLNNIMDNAMRYTPEGGRVLLSAKQVGEKLEMRIKDNGPGLSDQELGRVFDRFYRADPSRQRDESGSGLGLAIAKSLVERHNGRIWAESQPGQGMTVVISLPVEPGSVE